MCYLYYRKDVNHLQILLYIEFVFFNEYNGSVGLLWLKYVMIVLTGWQH